MSEFNHSIKETYSVLIIDENQISHFIKAYLSLFKNFDDLDT